MADTLVSPLLPQSGTPETPFVARPAEREADAQNMVALINAHRTAMCCNSVGEPPVPAVLGLIGETDQLEHPMSWVLYEGDRLRACFLLVLVCDPHTVTATDIYLDPEAPQATLGGAAALFGLDAPESPEPRDSPGPSLPLIAVVLTYWLVNYAYAGGACQAAVTVGGHRVAYPSARVTWVEQAVDIQIPDGAHLARCWNRQPSPRAFPELPPTG
ncbi:MULTISPECIES: hypothetical protein [Streptomyces]|uniref:hypothetical protein n=1 Tax=Streptomyces TaxID=1883 RepID=UPI0006B263F1|nr:MULTISPECIES: hypothetical protein [Streptomyces]KOT62938.1 hypothetical protein ADK43_09140 [Streptomyces rimosus subsp. rimosus]